MFNRREQSGHRSECNRYLRPVNPYTFSGRYMHLVLTAIALSAVNCTYRPAKADTGPEINASLEFEIRQTEAQDAEEMRQRDSALADIELTLEIEQNLGEQAKLESRLELSSRRYSVSELNNDDEELAYTLERLFFQFDSNPSLRFRVGRQSFSDPMETIVDENLDGVAIKAEFERTEFDLSYTRKDWFEADTAGRQDNITNLMAALTFSPGKNVDWIPYLLQRSAESFNGSDPEDAVWLGLQGIAEPNDSDVRYWIHAMTRDGELDAEASTEALGGYAIDFGVNYSIGDRFDSVITIAAAYASGGSRAKRFRQSGLHSNDFALNDKNTFRYLGEVLDPELTNIQILTLGWGTEPAKNWTTDIALHTYRQVNLEDQLRGADIEYEPLGINDNLGTGVDIVIAWEPDKHWQLQGTAGRFSPGNAFSSGRNDAWLARLEIGYSF